MTTNEELVGLFHRHVVPVFFTFQKGQEVQNVVVTAFVLSVSEQWFLITAGHCVSDIGELTEKHGYEITRCQLIDSLGLGARYRDPIPFVYERTYPTCLSDRYEFDYGVMLVSQYYKQLLEANNVHALDEEVWKKQPAKADFYMMLGIPADLVRVEADTIGLTPLLTPIERVSQKPDGFTVTEAPLFYGRIVLGEGIDSIKGMSGGPVFAFYRNEKGQLRYWLTALQSRWLPQSHYIAACPTKLLGHFLENLVSRLS